jgi:CRP-like cAMP-binding protein
VAVPVEFEQGQLIIRKGDVGDTFYIITEGSVNCSASLTLDTTSMNDNETNGNSSHNSFRSSQNSSSSPSPLAAARKGAKGFTNKEMLALNEGEVAVVENEEDGEESEKINMKYKMLIGGHQPNLDAETIGLSTHPSSGNNNGSLDTMESSSSSSSSTTQSSFTSTTTQSSLDNVQLHKGDWFGEVALLSSSDSRRTANVVACSPKVKLLAFNRDSFEKALGSLKDIIDKKSFFRAVPSLFENLPKDKVM